MTAKEKADELIGKLTNLGIKECALILVDEILESQPHFPSNVDWDDVGAAHEYFYEAQIEEAETFWLSVKSELNALQA